MEKRVIDISYHNGDIDFASLKGHVDGVIIRCGYGSDISTQDDKKFEANVQGCISNGIPFGFYLYSYAKNITMAESEAAHVRRLCDKYKDKMTYPIYYDLEEQGREQGAVERARVFCKILIDAGYKVGIYANEYWWNNYLVGLDEYTKWVAKYSKNKPNVSNYDIWQYDDRGSVAGISGKVDMNICYKDFGSTVSVPEVSKPIVEEVKDTIKEIIAKGQTYANNYINNKEKEIKVDGIRGKETRKAAQMVLQKALNDDYACCLTIDGMFYDKSKKAFGKHYVKRGETQWLVTALEILLMLKGYNPNGVECPGKFGEGLENCLEIYQKDNGLKVDKVAGYNTFMSLIE